MLLSLLLSISATTADTLCVPQAQVEGPFAIQQPYFTDSLNMAGKVFDSTEILQANSGLVGQSSLHNNLHSNIVKKGEPLTIKSDSLPALRLLRFSVEASRYTEGTFAIKSLANYRLYVNNVTCTDHRFKLAPGRAEVCLLTLTDKTSKDSFDIKLVGKNLQQLSINPTGKRPYVMADMLLGNHYLQASLSPTGKYLITLSDCLAADGTKTYTTTLTETDTGRELMRRNELMACSWLPGNRNHLYYTRKGAKGRELIIWNLDTNSQSVWAENLPEEPFNVSPNGDYLIFNRTDETTPNTNGLKQLREPDDRMPQWRQRNALWRYDLHTGIMQRLTYGSASVVLADISDNGKQLLLQYNRFDAHRVPFDRTTFVRMDAYSGHTDTLLADTTYIATAKFSPDANSLLILASPASFNGIGNEVQKGQTPNLFDNRLYLYNLTTRQVTPLLRNFNPAVESFEWARGDGNIYFTAADRTFKSAFKLNPNTLEVVRYELPVTLIKNFSIAGALRIPRAVCFGNSIDRAREMYVCTLNRTKPQARRIGPIDFDKNFGQVAIGSCHSWEFTAKRGDKIDGFYLLPPDFDASSKYPLIVYYYGGCTPTVQSLEYQYPLQVLAGQGYVVYVPNPSGAIGYGQEFAARHVNTWGKESGDDIIEGTEKFCAEHPFIDKSRIGCIGASYGGFMTQYLQTRTDLFATAISHAGISNITSYWGGGYWGYSYGECAQFGSYPWNNPELYVRQSPLFNADKIHTPLLLLHGTADTNVPTNESQQLFTALKILGREVCYVQVEGQDHVIVDYHKRLAWQDAIFAWFAKYLKNDSTWWDALNL